MKSIFINIYLPILFFNILNASVGLKDLHINFAIGLIGITIKHKTKFVKNCVATEAIAAPATPIRAIRNQFPITFSKAPDKLIIHKYFCFSSANIQIFRMVPIYEKAVYHVMIFNGVAAGKYASP